VFAELWIIGFLCVSVYLMKIILTLPYPPYSNNNQYFHRGRTKILKPAQKGYREEVIRIIKSKKIEQIKEQVFFKIFVYPPDKRKRDLD
jgi:Holliday junction resolvase RusA-like endonuclease